MHRRFGTGIAILGGGSGPANQVTHFSFSVPTDVTDGVPFDVTITALDMGDDVVPSYNGVLGIGGLSSSDPLAELVV